MTWFYIMQWFSNCGPWTSNIRISWELVRNAYSNLTPHLLNQRLGRWDLATWVLINPPDDYDSRQSSRTTGLAPCYYDCVLFTAEANQFFHTDLVLPVTFGTSNDPQNLSHGLLSTDGGGCWEIFCEGF